MPRMKEDSRTLLADLSSRLERLVAAAVKEGRDSALSDLRRAMGEGPRRGPGRPRKNSVAAPSRAKRAPAKGRRRKRKNPWASMTEEQRKERVRKMLAGRGLKPKSDR